MLFKGGEGVKKTNDLVAYTKCLGSCAGKWMDDYVLDTYVILCTSDSM